MHQHYKDLYVKVKSAPNIFFRVTETPCVWHLGTHQSHTPRIRLSVIFVATEWR